MCGIFVASQFGGVGLAEGMTIGSQVGAQMVGVVATIMWTAFATFIILKLVDAITGLRVSDEDEAEGLDISQHDERGYIL